MADFDRDALLNTVGKPTAAKAKLAVNSVDRAARILRLAICRSGIQQKTLGDDKALTSRKVAGTGPNKLWFHEMLELWPEEVWIELIALLAQEFGGTVERTVKLKDRSA